MWDALKQAVRDGTGLTSAGLHVVAAIAIFVVALIVLRRPGWAFLVVVVLQLGNEVLDGLGDIRSGAGVKLSESVMDSAITVGAAAVLWGIVWVTDLLSRR